MRWTEAELAAYRSRPPLSAAAVRDTAQKSKYYAKRCTWQGLQFDSLKELEDYKILKLQEAAGSIRSVVRQVSFPLQGSTRRIRVDFMVVELTGAIRWYDSKGFSTSEWLLKQKLVKDQYGLDIETI